MNNLSEVQLAGPQGPTPHAREAAQSWSRQALETARRARAEAPQVRDHPPCTNVNESLIV